MQTYTVDWKRQGVPLPSWKLSPQLSERIKLRIFGTNVIFVIFYHCEILKVSVEINKTTQTYTNRCHGDEWVGWGCEAGTQFSET